MYVYRHESNDALPHYLQHLLFRKPRRILPCDDKLAEVFNGLFLLFCFLSLCPGRSDLSNRERPSYLSHISRHRILICFDLDTVLSNSCCLYVVFHQNFAISTISPLRKAKKSNWLTSRNQIFDERVYGPYFYCHEDCHFM